ncbi:PepSY-associated TM helix domain-containing protein [Myroides pelagicus]|uniref:PepSY domain-containing protein n=1 Tax=Myroides pelagicus TaxID=270914 RepID=A0A7K1GM36_9FLAO|nr:PepSY-associated TM helix domain-containing protein [Myroides pelagicus]MEC4113351.1 PepSY-associated TM helix domain-containing protein [Myroides pelagicus]MTH29962.1 PepSY domain-containing protein [Myroides pelagicus]
MNVKNYNRYFHLHTISGIIITVILYIFFFAGSFSFFKNEIDSWQQNTPKKDYTAQTINYNQIIDSLDSNYGLYGRNISFRVSDKTRTVRLSVTPSKDTLNPKAKQRNFGYLNPETNQIKSYQENYGLGEFLYRLHFFAQVNALGKVGPIPVGYFIAGLVSFLFLFALLTGILVHWKKIVSNFYIFRPWEKIKTIWTDLHTALGVISFPFQLIFAITGSYFLLHYYVMMSSVAALGYQGDVKKLQEDVNFRKGPVKEVIFENKPLDHSIDINNYLTQTEERWKDAEITGISIDNYGDQSMVVTVNGKAPAAKQFNSKGELKYHVATNKVTQIADPFANPGYSYSFSNILYELHFGAFGGYLTRIVYFLVGVAGCIVIISGVLIWLVARDKKNVPEHKRKFNFWLANTYMAICLSMYPVTALSFIAVKIFPDKGQSFIYSFYFWTWLIATVLLLVRKNIYKTNRDCLLLGSIIGFCIPIVNGICTGDWLWNNYKNQYFDILTIDLFWIIVPIITLFAYRLVIRKHEQKQMTQ